MKGDYVNRLINEKSPYLLQHAHNPVDWYPWGEEALSKAKNENKLLIISVGYSACHWCHVMEQESFEDEEVAGVMNAHFINVKVDREERPDIDQYYMDAVQLISGRGGWPLNCFVLPDTRAVFGGTYFPKENWIRLLLNLTNNYKKEPQKFLQAAEEIDKGIKVVLSKKDFHSGNNEIEFSFLIDFAKKMSDSFDTVYGGFKYVPKFPMPSDYEFLLCLSHFQPPPMQHVLKEHVFLTLDKMAMGGIYDAVDGGFARYSTDVAWKVPHFEKMLYDNGQLMMLYSNAFRMSGKKQYEDVVYGIHHFISTKMTSGEGYFFSSVDADSEGKEGVYYTWTISELQKILKDEFLLFSCYYNVKNDEMWEHDRYILFRKTGDDEFCKDAGITVNQLLDKKMNWMHLLSDSRQKRIGPAIDDKCIASWNALMIKGYVLAYKAFGDHEFLDKALQCALFISRKMMINEKMLWHCYREGIAYIEGYSDDYAFAADAFFELYEITFDESWLFLAEKILNIAIHDFYDPELKMFYLTSKTMNTIGMRRTEIYDGVIPSSNSVFAQVLFKLGHALSKDEYIKISSEIIYKIKDKMLDNPHSFGNWATGMLDVCCKYYEAAITGKDSCLYRDKLNSYFLPNAIFVGTETSSDLDLLKGKTSRGETLIYICENKTCLAPVTTIDEALKILRRA